MSSLGYREVAKSLIMFAFTFPFLLEKPTQPFLNDCPLDYILPSDKFANCSCNTTNFGVPPALLVWEDPVKNVVAFTQNQTSLSLYFTSVNATFSENTYRCVLRHITGDLHVSYTPLLVVKTDDPEIEGFREIYTAGEIIELKCTVRGGVPKTQRIFFTCTNHPDRPDNIEDSQLTSSLVFKAEMTDNNTQCECYGTNDFFLSSMRSFILRVSLPGESEVHPPLMSLENCSKYFVGDAADCICVAENLGNSSSALLWKDPDGKTVDYRRTSSPSMRLALTGVKVKYDKQQYQCDLLHESGVQTISYTVNIAVSPSEPYLEENCSTDYQRSSTPAANCTCKTNYLGEPTALFVWDDPDGKTVVFTRDERSLALSFAAVNETHRGQAFRCILRHITGDFMIEYTPPKLIEAKQDKDDGLSSGAIAGIVVAVIAVVVALAVVIGIIIKKKHISLPDILGKILK